MVSSRCWLAASILSRRSSCSWLTRNGAAGDHAADRVERRAYFVRHVGDERTLGLVGASACSRRTGAQPDDAEADVGGKFFQQLDFVGLKALGFRGIDAQGAEHRFAVLLGQGDRGLVARVRWPLRARVPVACWSSRSG